METVAYRGRDVAFDGTKEELAAFIEFQREKAKSFIDEGYSVEWNPDGFGYMSVYLPTNSESEGPEVMAVVKFIPKPHETCLNGGKISQLNIVVSHLNPLRGIFPVPPDPAPVTLYRFYRNTGPGIDRLGENAEARKLHETVVKELS